MHGWWATLRGRAHRRHESRLQRGAGSGRALVLQIGWQMLGMIRWKDAESLLRGAP